MEKSKGIEKEASRDKMKRNDCKNLKKMTDNLNRESDDGDFGMTECLNSNKITI